MLLERCLKYHRYIPHNRGLDSAGAPAVQACHSRANVLTKSLCQLSRSSIKPLNRLKFLWAAGCAAPALERGPNLARQKGLRTLRRRLMTGTQPMWEEP